MMCAGFSLAFLYLSYLIRKFKKRKNSTSAGTMAYYEPSPPDR